MSTARDIAKRFGVDESKIVKTRVENATFHAFKGWSPSLKWGYSGRGYLSPDVFGGHSPEERMAQLLMDNDGCWPGMSGPGEEYYLVVIADEEVDHGWPLMFKPIVKG